MGPRKRAVPKPGGTRLLNNGANAPSQRDVRASKGRSLAEGYYSALPGESRSHLGTRPGDTSGVVPHQAPVGDPAAPLHQNQTPVRLRTVFTREYLRARHPFVS